MVGSDTRLGRRDYSTREILDVFARICGFAEMVLNITVRGPCQNWSLAAGISRKEVSAGNCSRSAWPSHENASSVGCSNRVTASSANMVSARVENSDEAGRPYRMSAPTANTMESRVPNCRRNSRFPAVVGGANSKLAVGPILDAGGNYAHQRSLQ